jgi:urease accessory protein
LSLRLARRGERTVLVEQRHEGPLLVQRPFYPEGEQICHVVVLHPPGGIVQGDRLRVDLEVEPGAHGLVTTTGATRFYRGEGLLARLEQHLSVQDGAVLEWLPQETIVFEGAYAEAGTRVEMAKDGRFLGWEILCLGRPASGEGFARGSVLQTVEIWREGRPLLWERGRYEGGSPALNSRWGLGGHPVVATLAVAGPDPIEAGPVREALKDRTVEGLYALTSIGGVLVGRFLGGRAEAARQWLSAVWSVVRPGFAGCQACEPRIWRA